MAVPASTSPLVFLLVPALVLLLFGFALALVRYRRTRTRGAALATFALAAGAVVVGSLFAYGTYESYRQQNTWTFGYDVTIQANGSAPEAIVAPVPMDEALLTGLQLDQGVANWSLVSTAHGRGLYIRFAGSAMLHTYLSQFPPPAVAPDSTATMVQPSNCTMPSSNCTGLPSYWMFYSGTAGVYVRVSLSWSALGGYLRPGWAAYQMLPSPVP